MNIIVLAAQQAQGGGMGMIIMMVALFAIMYFFMIRPQQKKQKEIRKFQNALAEGTKVHLRHSTPCGPRCQHRRGGDSTWHRHFCGQELRLRRRKRTGSEVKLADNRQ